MNPPPPSGEEISKKLKLIYEIREKGRTAKSENEWTDLWEEGINHFCHAVEIAQEWNNKLKAEIARADQLIRQKYWNRLNIEITILVAAGFFYLGSLF